MKMGGRSLLWVAPRWPVPAVDGARRATYNLLQELCRSGHQVDLVALASADQQVDLHAAAIDLGLRSARLLNIPTWATQSPSKWSLLCTALRNPLTPASMKPYVVGQAMQTILASGSWDAMVYDGLHAACHGLTGGRYKAPPLAPPVIYRAHNREAQSWQRSAFQASNPLVRWYLQWQAWVVRRFEDSLVRSALLAAVSQQDLELFGPHARGRVVPIGYEFEAPPTAPPSNCPQILFVGKLDWAPNHQGLRWFLQRVWPAVSSLRTDLELVVAGSGEPGDLLTLLRAAPHCRFIGCAERLDLLYRGAWLCLVPIFYGGGTRVKAIEAASFGRAVLSTKIGVEGLGLSSYLEAESEPQWIAQLAQLEHTRAVQVGRAAHAELSLRFCARAAAASFESLLLELPFP